MQKEMMQLILFKWLNISKMFTGKMFRRILLQDLFGNAWVKVSVRSMTINMAISPIRNLRNTKMPIGVFRQFSGRF